METLRKLDVSQWRIVRSGTIYDALEDGSRCKSIVAGLESRRESFPVSPLFAPNVNLLSAPSSIPASYTFQRPFCAASHGHQLRILLEVFLESLDRGKIILLAEQVSDTSIICFGNTIFPSEFRVHVNCTIRGWNIYFFFFDSLFKSQILSYLKRSSTIASTLHSINIVEKHLE